MKPFPNHVSIFLLLIVFQSCNTLYNSQIVNIEILQPSEIMLDPGYKNLVVRYNNFNLCPDPDSNIYYEGNKRFRDTTKLDSIASYIYFDLMVENLSNNNYFDTIIPIVDYVYSDIILDSAFFTFQNFTDSAEFPEKKSGQKAINNFAELINYFPQATGKISSSLTFNPELGFYSEKDLKEIADSTDADLLLSLDLFSALDGISYYPNLNIGNETVLIGSYWNIYDLKEKKLWNFFPKNDTIIWKTDARTLRETKKLLPSRRDAIFNAADIAGTNFAQCLVPHWNEVQRMYYRSGHLDLKKASDLVKENKFLEAAKIWKSNVNNPNKKIAAKSMFNMALVCEMNGDFEAAIDWVVQSYHKLSNLNEPHYSNCLQYIRILAHRMIDTKKLDIQLNPEEFLNL